MGHQHPTFSPPTAARFVDGLGTPSCREGAPPNKPEAALTALTAQPTQAEQRPHPRLQHFSLRPPPHCPLPPSVPCSLHHRYFLRELLQGPTPARPSPDGQMSGGGTTEQALLSRSGEKDACPQTVHDAMAHRLEHGGERISLEGSGLAGRECCGAAYARWEMRGRENRATP